ncbi:MAG: phosphatase PAP2 family protein [Polyangiales bacterium]
MNGVRNGSALATETSRLDRLLFAYYAALIACCIGGSGELRTAATSAVACLFLLHATTVLAVRSGFLGRGAAAAIVYRIGVYGCFQSSYFALRWVLPTARSICVDEKLLKLDLALFHVEPALYLDRFVNPHTTEWFAFFYFSYFFLLASFVLPMLFWCRDLDLLSEFATSVIMLLAVAHLLYIIVPGFGPWWYMADQFQHRLPSGRFLDLVMSAVHTGGAQKDIFPSVHTAAPTLLTLFAFRNRARMPFKIVWPVMAFFTCNIIVATLFLRWHYVIDVFAGLALAFTVWHVGYGVAKTEIAKRKADGLPHPWLPLRPPVAEDDRELWDPTRQKEQRR